jgi:hypothetical protein
VKFWRNKQGDGTFVRRRLGETFGDFFVKKDETLEIWNVIYLKLLSLRTDFADSACD